MTQAKSNRRIAQNTAFLYIRMLVTLFVGLYTSRIVLRELGIVDYGLQNVVGSLLSLFTFIQGSLSSSASRFLAFEIGKSEEGNLNNIFCMTQNIHILFALFVFILAETLGLWYFHHEMVIPANRFTTCLIVYQLSIVSAVFSILVVPYNAMIIAQERMKAFAYLSIVNVFAKLAIAFALCITPIDKLITSASLGFILTFCIRLLYLQYCKKNFQDCKFHFIWEKRIMRDMLVFSGWSMCSYTKEAINQASNLLINLFFGPAVNAARAIANTVQQNVYAFVLNFQVALNPQIVKNVAKNEMERLFELVDMSQRISFALLFILLFPLIVNVDFVLKLWLVKVPDYTQPLLIIVCLTSIFSAISNPLGVIAEAKNRLKIWNLILMPYYLCSLFAAYLFLKNGGNVAGTFIVFGVFELTSYLIKLKIAHTISQIPIRPLIIIFIKVAGTLLIACVIGYYLKSFTESDLIGFIKTSILITAFSFFWLWFTFLNGDERIVLKNKIIQKINK